MGDRKRKLGGRDDPIILHFSCVRFADFLQKYKRLGNFSDFWMGSKRAGEFVDTIHLESRDIVQGQDANDAVLLNFYIDNFVMSPEKIEILLRHNLVRAITFHAELLSPILHPNR